MKQLQLCVILMTISLIAYSQAYIGLSAEQHGVGAEVGYRVQNTSISLRHQLPIFRNDIPTISSISVGQSIDLGSSIDITPSAGISIWSRKDFTDYDRHLKDYPVTIKKTPLYLNLELSKTMYSGSLYISGAYSNNIYWTAGIRYIFNNNK